VRKALALPVLLLALVLSSCGGAEAGPGQLVTEGSDGWAGTRLDQPYRVEGDMLTDTDGKPYSLARSTDAPVTLVFFGYTHCPDICQMVMANLASAKLKLPEADRDRVDVVLVTTDPARDDPRTLRSYLDRFDPEFIGLTGDLPTLDRVGRSVAVWMKKGRKLPSGGYDVEHNDHVVALTRDDRAPLLWTRDASAAEIAGDVRKLLDQETG